MLFTMLFASIGLFFSCSTDDSGGGSGGGGIPTPVNFVIYAASNKSNTIAYYEIRPEDIYSGLHYVSSDKNEGILYDKDKDELILNSIPQRSTNIYGNMKGKSDRSELSLEMSGNSVLQNPHDVVKKDQFYIVSDSEPESEEGKIYIFERDENGMNLRNTVSLGYEVYGLEMVGNDLYHTIANTKDVAAFKDFLTTFTGDTLAAPHKRISIDGIKDVRGISFDRGVLVLTDVGEWSSNSDGALHWIRDFVTKFNNTDNGESLAIGEQIRVSGRLTKLGNPIDVAYDHDNGLIYVAENTRDGGAVLFFDNIQAGGEITPHLTFLLDGASSVTYGKLR